MGNDLYCPYCGEFVTVLVERTGWCVSCTPPLISTKEQQLENWFNEHGDELDRLLADGHKITKAITIVADSIRPKCLCCGEEMRRANPKTALFCSKYAQCRKMRRRLTYYKQDLGMKPEEALDLAMSKLEIEQAQSEAA